MEPLGESQVLNYLKKISGTHNILLITFEKIDDLQNKIKFEDFQEVCSINNISWKPLKYSQSIKYASSIVNILKLYLYSLKILLVNNIHIIHIRSYMPGLAALPLKKIFKLSLVFDMRGLWADEKVDRLGWSKKQIKYKFFKFLEQRLLQESESVITLTNELKDYLEYQGYSDSKIIPIRTCVNFDLFFPTKQSYTNKESAINLGYLGSADTAYDIKPVLKLFSQMQKIQKNIKLKIFTKSDPNLILKIARKIGIEPNFLEISFCERQNLNNEINKLNAIIFYLKPSFSLLASMPTKIGESLACNVPIICNAFNGDISKLISENDIGKLIKFNGAKEEALDTLGYLNYFGQKTNCLELAKSEFDLEKAAQKISKIYLEI